MAYFEKIKKNKTGKTIVGYRIRALAAEPFRGASFLLAAKTYSEAAARECCSIVDELERAYATGDELSQSLKARIEKRPDFKKRLLKKGFILDKPEISLRELFTAYADAMFRGMAANTQRNKAAARDKLFSFFGEDALLSEIREKQAVAFIDAMRERYSTATCAGYLKEARAVWNWGLENALVAAEYGRPFAKPKRGSFKNPERLYFVDKTTYRKILAACPDADWRAIVALCRVGGLRNPSETLAARWEDVDFKSGRFIVRSQKTKRYDGKARREIPLFPELRRELEPLYRARDVDSAFVITRYRDSDSNMRTTFEKILRRAGVERWERLFQNLRASRAQELNQEGFSPYVVAEWLGHSPEVEREHYVKANAVDFKKALTPTDDETNEQESETVENAKTNKTNDLNRDDESLNDKDDK